MNRVSFSADVPDFISRKLNAKKTQGYHEISDGMEMLRTIRKIADMLEIDVDSSRRRSLIRLGR